MLFSYLLGFKFILVMIGFFSLSYLILIEIIISSWLFVEGMCLKLKPFHSFLHLIVWKNIASACLEVGYYFVSILILYLVGYGSILGADYFYEEFIISLFVILLFIDLLSLIRLLNFDFVQMRLRIYVNNLMLLIV